MNSVDLLGASDDQPALIDADADQIVTYAELRDLVLHRKEWAKQYRGKLVFLGIQPTINCIVDLLALFSSGAVSALINPETPDDVVLTWAEAYYPDVIIGLGVRDWRQDARSAKQLPRELPDAILLPTSGSTGNPKFVRLSAANVIANAAQIASALSIDRSHRALGHLPLFYSYGLSVLTSHLCAGASVTLTNTSAIEPGFWRAMERYSVTSLPGVPYHYEMYRRMGLLDRDLPALRDVTQAGGRLNNDRVREFHQELSVRGVRMWVMYGQTEATARIAVMPYDELGSHIGSVGYAIPDGRVEIVDPDEEGIGEVQFSGPNVMLGYAESKDDLHAGDVMNGVLSTGDLGRLDKGGRLWIVGRTKRIAKVFGTRVNLDDVERTLAALGRPLAATAGEDCVNVFVESPEEVKGFGRQCERALGFSPGSIQVIFIQNLPLTAAGKVNYQELLS